MPPFDLFWGRLETVFSALHKQPGFNIIKYSNFQLYREKEKIYIYEQTKTNIVAYFIPGKSYIDNAKLYDKLSDMLPDYIPYFRNEKNLIKEEDWNADKTSYPEI